MCISRPCLTLFESTRRRTAACCVKAWPGSLTDAPTQGKSLFIITFTNNDHNSLSQCSGSASGSVCVLVSWIRIRIRNLFVQIRIRILPSTRKKMKKNLDFYCFVTQCYFRRLHTTFARALSSFLKIYTREWQKLGVLTEHRLSRLCCITGNCTDADTEILLRVENKQRSRVRMYIWSTHGYGLWKTEGGATPPLARTLNVCRDD
jgi:hypothetical protein